MNIKVILLILNPPEKNFAYTIPILLQQIIKPNIFRINSGNPIPHG